MSVHIYNIYHIYSVSSQVLWCVGSRTSSDTLTALQSHAKLPHAKVEFLSAKPGNGRG